MKIKLCIVVFLSFFLQSVSFAATYAGGFTVKRVRLIGNEVMFAVSAPPAGTCSNYGEHFRFLLETDDDMARYSMLLTAKASGQPIAVWFYESSRPGTDQTTGCNADASAKLYGLALM